MAQVPRRFYWPYDEVTASRDSSLSHRFHFSAPWLKFHVDIEPHHVERTAQVVEKLGAGEITPDDLSEINWLFASLAKYPMAYILPRVGNFGRDKHEVLNPIKQNTPSEMFLELTKSSPFQTEIKNIADRYLTKEWMWDAPSALEFSKVDSGYDPQALFSVARRFHLLNDLECNRTADLLEKVSAFAPLSAEFKKATALMIRGNHYVTQKCDGVLRPSLALAQGADETVREFIQAESGHDVILAQALKSMDVDPDKAFVLESIKVLMEIFGLIARKNFLAFSMVVDIFERTSYQAEDPFAALLRKGGYPEAAKHLDHHREINDSGEHENAALGFLDEMAPVDADYAMEAVLLAELTTQVAHLVSLETLERIQ